MYADECFEVRSALAEVISQCADGELDATKVEQAFIRGALAALKAWEDELP